MKSYWHNLNERERWIFGFGGVLCGLFLIYSLIYAPMANAVRNKTRQLAEKQATLTWMQQVQRQHRTGNVPAPLSNSMLLSMLANQLKSTSFHTFSYQLQQTGVGDIQLSFEQVPYNAFVSWLWAIREKYAFSIKQLNVERTPTPGVVKILVTVVAL